MCDPNRPQSGIQSMLPGARMISPATQAGAPSVAISMVQSPYGLISAHPPQYMTHMAYSHQLPSVPGQIPLVSAVPPMLPGMYVSVPQVAGAQILPTQMRGISVPTGLVSPNIDSSKLIEHQKKLEKERNFQLQQQRLKQFTVAGKKENINAENLIDNMFGKSYTKETSKLSLPSQPKPKDLNQSKELSAVTSIQSPSVLANMNNSTISLSSPVSSFSTEQKSIPSTNKPENKKKNLDFMMLECSDLSGPQKANKFTKPIVKEIAPSVQLRSTFAASDKARNWRDVKGLDSVFVAKKPRFPAWCCKAHVPEVYHRIEDIVTENGAHLPETNLLFPILLSSQLPQQLLAQIWELVNQSSRGHLTVEEMYAALALIAVAQAGHAIKTVDILHQLPSCPIPHLQPITNPEPTNATKESFQTSTSSPNVSNVDDSFNSSTQNAVRPSSLSRESNITSNIAPSNIRKDNLSQPVPSVSEFVSTSDDDFDDFKSATPTCVSFFMPQNSTSNLSLEEDEFDDFKQAPPLAISSMVKNDEKIAVSSPTIEQDLMSPEEDKYSVFRLLQQSDDANSWGQIASTTADFKSSCEKEMFDASDRISLNSDVQKEVPVFSVTDAPHAENKVAAGDDDDEFGDFLHAEIKQDPGVASVTNDLQNLGANFADFSHFNENSTPLPTLSVSESVQPDDEFGEFTSSLPVSNKIELGQEFLFNNLKDNISLAESQSVSSLELGTFDGGGHSGESKSSMSRQGSIPSLDLKSTNIEVVESEDCFGELQSASTLNKAFKIPSPPSNDIKGIENNDSSVAFQSMNVQTVKPIPLVDKYSVIRSEEKKEEDPYISSWNQCLQSSISILQNTKKIFNKMSCSAICNEVLSSEEGGNYVKDVVEIYKIICRITLSSKTYGKQTSDILNLSKEAEQIWSSLSSFFTGSNLLSLNSCFDYSSALLDNQAENNSKACGLCLLNVEYKNSKNEDSNLTLSYGGRNYHNTCANFWVNCVDPLLPALNLPQLL